MGWHIPGLGWAPAVWLILPPLLQVFIPSSSESSDEEDEELCMLEWAFTMAMWETEIPHSSGGLELFLTDCSDSDD